MKPHPKLIQNRRRKSFSKIWKIIFDAIVDNSEEERFIEITWIVDLEKKYGISSKTLQKYLKNNIFIDEWAKYKKMIVLHSQDIENWKKIIEVYNSLRWATPEEQKIVFFLFEYLTRKLKEKC